MKQVTGYDDIFADEDGNIYKNWKRAGLKKLSPYRCGPPYLYVKVHGKHKYVHRLIAITFCGNKPSPQHQCRHINGDCTDNRACNLAWGTVKENMADKRIHGTHGQGELHSQAKITESDVLWIRSIEGPLTMTLADSLAKKLGVARSHIYRIRSRTETARWKHMN